jgi:hypothetical protein
MLLRFMFVFLYLLDILYVKNNLVFYLISAIAITISVYLSYLIRNI